VRVMQSYSALRETTNPYLSQLDAALSRDVDVRAFSWRDAVRGRFDVLHLHWPEVLVRSPSRARTWLRRAAMLAVLLQVRLGRRALVRTVHNTAPHESGSRTEALLLRLIDRSTSVFVLLVPRTPLPVPGASAVVIPHGDYREWFSTLTVPPAEAGRLAYVGLVRRYKGVEELLAVFRRTAAADGTDLQLHIVGKVQDRALAIAVREAAAADARVTARLEYVPDHDLADEIGRAELVVLPYREMHNSGTALLALSLGRPVLVPGNAVTEELAAEVGERWVQTYAGALTPAALTDALAAVRGQAGDGPPDLRSRTWPEIGQAHVHAYRQALAQRGHRWREAS